MIAEWVNRKEQLLERINAYASQVSRLRPTPDLSKRSIDNYLAVVLNHRDRLETANYEEFLAVQEWWQGVQDASAS